MSDTSRNSTILDNGSEAKSEVSPGKRDRSASEDRLVKAGIEIFSKFGFDGCTTRMIAKKADVNESLIGRYFDGKEGLLLAIIEIFIKELHGEELPYPPQDNITAELTNYVEFKMSNSRDRECLGKIIISHALTNPKFRKKALTRVPMFVDHNLEARLKLLQEKGLLKTDKTLQKVCEEIENYLHGAFIFDILLKEMPREVVLKDTVEFIHQYCNGFKA